MAFTNYIYKQKTIIFYKNQNSPVDYIQGWALIH